MTTSTEILFGSIPSATFAAPRQADRISWNSIERFAPDEIIPFQHDMASELLLSIQSLRALAKRVYPKGQVKFKASGSPGLFSIRQSHADGRSIDEVFDRLEEPGTWVAIYNMAADPMYAELCENILSELRSHIGGIDPGMYGADLAIFLSAPPTETPYHIDQHPNFFFQLKGRKWVNLWDSRDPEVVTPRIADDFLCWQPQGLVKYEERLRPKVIEFELKPGQGVYWPATTPHYMRTQPYWAKPGDGVSLSLNISYYTRATRRRVCISAVNRLMRKLPNVEPTPFGISPLRDSLKHPVGRTYFFVRRLITREYQLPQQKL